MSRLAATFSLAYLFRYVAGAVLLLTPTIALGQQDAWRQQANERIETLRQRETQVRVVDHQGQPVAGVEVAVKQTAQAFPFGAAITPAILRNPGYQQFFLEHFNWAVFENETKWYSNERRRGREDYTRPDAMLAWCNEHNIPVRGHCIFWEPEKWQPRWLRDLDSDELRAAVEGRVESVVTRYRGQLRSWDVNNEMLHGSFFQDRLGDDIHAWMFNRVHELDPQAQLFVNEFNILSVDENFSETEADQYVEHTRRLIEAGAPVQGVGVQGHVWAKTAVEHPERLKQVLDKVAELGLPIWISEFDSAFDDDAVNADALEAVYRTAYSHPAVEGIVMWVFWEASSWRGENAGLARRDWTLKPAGERYEALMAEWSTDTTGVTDADGAYTFRGFHGDLTVTVRDDLEQLATQTIQLTPGDEVLVVTVEVETPGR